MNSSLHKAKKMNFLKTMFGLVQFDVKFHLLHLGPFIPLYLQFKLVNIPILAYKILVL